MNTSILLHVNTGSLRINKNFLNYTVDSYDIKMLLYFLFKTKLDFTEKLLMK